MQAFHTVFAPFEYLSAVVVQELRAGATPAQAGRLQGHVFARFERRGRVLTPGYAAWKEAGVILARLVDAEGFQLRAVARDFVNDVRLDVRIQPRARSRQRNRACSKHIIHRHVVGHAPLMDDRRVPARRNLVYGQRVRR